MIHAIPPTIRLVRHGQSQANAGGITLENSVVPLTPLGQLQSTTVAPLLPATQVAIFSSPFKRAMDTAKPYCGRTGLQPVVQDDLKEFETVDTAVASGGSCAEREAIIAQYWQESHPDKRTGPGAETFREFYHRVARVRAEWLPGLPDGTVIFGHGMWYAMLFWQFLGFEKFDHAGMQLFRRFQLGFPMPNAVVYAISHRGHRHWDIKADEAAMRAIAAIGTGVHTDPADAPRERKIV